ncbi:hypothetical protein SJAV_12190 [Sulfurisphaera javensis]|uniref:Uncharacterized protein n=1 Tax=Sulfurisphaera javensis TaxID=2049879 RepID=A0AAT9GR70_9CREN
MSTNNSNQNQANNFNVIFSDVDATCNVKGGIK